MPKFNHNKINKLKLINRFLKLLFFYKQKPIKGFNINEVQNKEILIICFYLIGDSIMYLPAITVLKKYLPKSNISIVGTKVVKEIYSHQKITNNYFVVDCPWIAPFNKSISNLFNTFKIILNLRKFNYDIVIDFRGDFRNIFFMNFLKATYKLSYNFTGGEYLLTNFIIPNKNIFHFTEEAMYFIKELKIPFSENEKIPQIKLFENDLEVIHKIKIEKKINNELIIGVHPGSSLKIKQWDEAKFSNLIIKINSTYNNPLFIIFIGPNEEEVTENIVKKIQGLNINYIIYKDILINYIRLMSVCNYVICNDSGAAHISGALNLKTLIIFANVEPKFVTPLNNNFIQVISKSLPCKPCFNTYCRLGTNECINSITIDDVFNGFIKLN